MLETSAHLCQLDRLQAGLTPSPARLFEAAFALLLPVLVPAPARFARHAHPASHLGLPKSLFEELSGLEAALLQRREVPFDTFRIAHAQDYSMDR